MKKIEIRLSEIAKVPSYTKTLKNAIRKSKTVGIEKALAEWASKISKRRLPWLKKHKNGLKLREIGVREAFELIMYKYMGIKPGEIEIVEETDKKIIYRCYNFCPYLEAIKKLGQDTRVICKHTTESSVQALLEVINPRLRYSRNYETGIRPYVEYCEETIELVVKNTAV